jgi:hypothetical protein
MTWEQSIAAKCSNNRLLLALNQLLALAECGRSTSVPINADDMLD